MNLNETDMNWYDCKSSFFVWFVLRFFSVVTVFALFYFGQNNHNACFISQKLAKWSQIFRKSKNGKIILSK